MGAKLSIIKIFSLVLLILGFMPLYALAETSENSSYSNQTDVVLVNDQESTIDQQDSEVLSDNKKSESEDILNEQGSNTSRKDSDSSETQSIERNGSITSAVSVDEGIYFIFPAQNSNLCFAPGSNKLAKMPSSRMNALAVSFSSSGTAKISNSEGKYLTASENKVRFADENSDTSQEWSFMPAPSGGYNIKNAKSGLVLDISGERILEGTQVGLHQPNNSDAQRWMLKDITSIVTALDDKAKKSKGILDSNSIYYIETGICDNKVLDVDSQSTKNGANVQLYSFNKSGAQQWKITYDSKGYATLTNVASGKVLDVTSGAIADKTNVQQYSHNDSYAQKWIITHNPNGSYSIESALWPDVSLDVASGSSADRTNVQILLSNGLAEQQFNLITEAGIREELDELAHDNKSAISDGVYLINSDLSFDKVLDVTSASKSDRANIQIYSSNMSDAQQWRVSHDKDGYVVFTNVRSGKVLDVESASIAPRTNVQQYTYNDSYAQKWIVTQNDNGTYDIKSALWKGLSLDITGASSLSGTNVQIFSENNSEAQHFKFINYYPKVEPCEDLNLEGKYYRISSTLDRSLVVDISSGSRANGANAQLYKNNGSYAQLFTFHFVKAKGDRGYYQIICAQSGKALDVDGGNLVNGTNIQQWEPDQKNDNQLFSIKRNSDGSFVLINKATGLVVDVASARTSNGTNIQVFEFNESSAQSFFTEEVNDYLPEGAVVLHSALSASKVVDVEGGSLVNKANIQLYSSNGSLAQKWNVTKVGENSYTFQSIYSGKNLAVVNNNVVQENASSAENQIWTPSIVNGYTVLTNKKTGKVLDVANASTANGTNIWVHQANSSDAQLFDISSTSLLDNGIYNIQAFADTGYVLDVAGESRLDKANVQLYKDNDSGAQKWNVFHNNDGTYTFKNVVSGKALDLNSGKAVPGGNIQQFTSNGSLAQKWYLEYVDGGGIKIISAVNKLYSVGISSSGYKNGSNIELQALDNSFNQRFTFGQTKYDPMPEDQRAMLNRINGYSSGTSWLLAVDRQSHKVGVFKGSVNNWSLQYYWNCTTGAPGSPTITGSYLTTGFKRNALSTDSRAIWCTQIWGGYFFHSILASENELGKSLSHGCIRLPYSAAQWIHSNIYAGTRVVIYN